MRRAAFAYSCCVALLLAALGGTGCGDGLITSVADTTGALRIRVITTGLDLDPDGYRVSVDGIQGWFVPTGDGAVTVGGLVAGRVHVVELGFVAANCSVSGDNPRAVSVVRRTTVEVVFVVACLGIGSIRITTTTTGVELDPDGYSVSLDDGSSRTIATNGTITIASLLVGPRRIELLGVIRNCAVGGENPRWASVDRGATTEVVFAVTCVATGSARITTTTTGVDLDPNGYGVTLTAGTFDTTANVAANGTVTISGLAAGDHSVTLGEMSMNCDVAGTNRRTVTVPSGGTATIAFDVACAQATQLAVALAVSGNTDVYLVKANGAELTRLTTHAAHDADPTWSPDGAKIAFRSERDGDAEIYVMNTNGSNQVRLTNVAHADYQPAWSPDGTKIAFVSDRDGNAEIYVMNADGTNPVRLTDNSVIDADPAWSPDGAKIAFSSRRDGNFGQIYLMNADGSGVTRRTSSATDDVQPAWSPDGMKLAFSRLTGCDYYSYACDYDAYVMSADGSGAAPLPSGYSDTEAAWSPDGRWIAFTAAQCDYYDCYYNAVRVVRADLSRVAEVLSNAFQPAWRPR